MSLATTRYISANTNIRQLCFRWSSFYYSPLSVSTIWRNYWIRRNRIHTSVALSASNTFRSNSTWNESSLPEKIQSLDEYKQLYSLSIKDPSRFWKMAAERLDWYHFPTTIKNTEFDYRTQRGVDIKWYEDGILNACYNCLDRHIDYNPTIAQQVAYIFEPDEPSHARYHVTYGELLGYVSKFANILKKHGVRKGDRVTIYMPMVVEACVAILACARIGAVHSVVFAGFSASHIADRIVDCDSKVVITSDFGIRGGKTLLLKNKVDEALRVKQCRQVQSVLVFGRNQGLISLNKEDSKDSEKIFEWTEGRDFWVHHEMEKVSDRCEPERMNAEDPLFIVRRTKISYRIFPFD